MSEEKQKRVYTKRNPEEKQIAVIKKIEADIEKIQASLDAKKAVLAEENKKLEDIKNGIEKARVEAEQKEMVKLIKDSGMSLEDLKNILMNK